MSLNPNAKPFVFNPTAADFVPSSSFTQQLNPPQSSQQQPQQTDNVPTSWEDEPPQPSQPQQTKTVFPTKQPNRSSPRAAAIQQSTSIDSLSEKLDTTSLGSLDDDEKAELEEAAAEEAAAKKKGETHSQKIDSAKAHDWREHLNIVFIGHVDAGKSTISGRILLVTGQVDERTIQKYEKEAKEKNRESWYLAYILDTNEEERAKGKTVEVGRAKFSTEKKRYTLLDAPGHKNYVPNMIGGASQADVGVLVISARKGEFEAGFDRGGQTREHAMLAKTLGLQKLVVLVNKMDDVNWDQKRYDEIEKNLSPFLKKCGFNLKTDVVYVPASGFTGANIAEPVANDVCPWYTSRKSLFQVLDDLPPINRDPQAGLRLPIIARYKDMGALFCLGKLESGTLLPNTKLLMMPNKIEVQCTGVFIDEDEVDCAKPGENVLARIKGIEEEDVQEGFVLSYLDKPCKRAKKFDAQVAILDLLEHKPILTTGYECILHVHTLTMECQITHIIHGIDRKTGEKVKKIKFLKSNDFAVIRVECPESVAIEKFEDYPALGRFTLRDEGKTIAIGKILGMAAE